MGARYEIQVLDSYENPTYFEGQCASVYNQRPPMVNASPQAGRVADLRHRLHRAALRRTTARCVKPAYVTVLHNGVLVQNHTEMQGNTFYDKPNGVQRSTPRSSRSC